jgi:hypothetical protein
MYEMKGFSAKCLTKKTIIDPKDATKSVITYTEPATEIWAQN